MTRSTEPFSISALGLLQLRGAEDLQAGAGQVQRQPSTMADSSSTIRMRWRRIRPSVKSKPCGARGSERSQGPSPRAALAAMTGLLIYLWTRRRRASDSALGERAIVDRRRPCPAIRAADSTVTAVKSAAAVMSRPAFPRRNPQGSEDRPAGEPAWTRKKKAPAGGAGVVFLSDELRREMSGLRMNRRPTGHRDSGRATISAP